MTTPTHDRHAPHHGGTQATATAAVSSSGVVSGFTGVVPGEGYTAFAVAVSGDGGAGDPSLQAASTP